MTRETVYSLIGSKTGDFDINADRLKTRIEEILSSTAPDGAAVRFLCAFEKGGDMHLAAAAMHIREERPGITIESVIPFEDHAVKRKSADRNNYYNMLATCDKETMMQRPYTKGAAARAVRWMVQRSDYVITLQNKGLPNAFAVMASEFYGRAMFVIESENDLRGPSYSAG